jgi:hypothetical protein
LSLSNWNERLHHHIVKLHRQKGEQWMQDLQQLAPLLMNRYESLKRYWKRPEDVLREKFEELFGKFELESLSVQTNVDKLMDVDEQQSSSNVATAGETTSDNEPQLDNQVENSNCNNKAGNKEKRKGFARGGRNKHKLRKGEKSAVETGSDQNSDPEIDQEAKKAAPAILNGRANMDAYRARAAGLAFLRIPAERDDTPVVYRRVLQLLREADRSNLWPSSSTGRQMVIETDTLVENGGRGGSFSVGALPRHMPSPRGNELFPDLMRACFELERTLLPERPPSATIAINRHAQFLPHRDTGAGAGQTKSLIVSLGCFVGGEIMVDNDVHDIRYRPLEFDGWNSIHCTLPFVGERYSLVWFTPLGLTEEDMWWLRDTPAQS